MPYHNRLPTGAHLTEVVLLGFALIALAVRFFIIRDPVLLALLRDPGLRERIGAANRAKAVREFDQETMFATYAALYSGDGAVAPVPAS